MCSGGEGGGKKSKEKSSPALQTTNNKSLLKPSAGKFILSKSYFVKLLMFGIDLEF